MRNLLTAKELYAILVADKGSLIKSGHSHRVLITRHSVGMTTTTKPTFTVWKTIKLGTGLTTADDFRTALKENNFDFGEWADNLLGKTAFTTASKETEADLVIASLADLGLRRAKAAQYTIAHVSAVSNSALRRSARCSDCSIPTS
jgi:hypothetical protein